MMWITGSEMTGPEESRPSSRLILFFTLQGKSNLVKVHEDQFIDEFLPKVVCSSANCEIIDKEGNTKGYITEKELSKALTKEHMANAAKST